MYVSVDLLVDPVHVHDFHSNKLDNHVILVSDNETQTLFESSSDWTPKFKSKFDDLC